MTVDSQLSEREREILQLVATGASNQQIADQLTISINTVKVHLRNIFGKIGAASRTEATLYAIRQGIAAVDERGTPVVPLAEEPSSAVGLNVPINGVSPTPPHPVAELNDTRISSERDAAAVQAVISQADQGKLPQLIMTAAAPAVAPGEQLSSSTMHAPAQPVRLTRWLIPVLLLALLAALGTIALLLQRPATVAPSPTVAPTGAPALAPNSRWFSRTAAPNPRSDAAVVGFDGRAYLLGGRDQNGVLRSVATFNPATGQWGTRSDLPTAAAHAAAAVARGKIYVVGGEDANGQPIAAAVVFDPQSDRFEPIPDLPEPRSRSTMVAVEGLLYLFGGWDGKNDRNDVWVYEPGAQAWRPLRPMPTPRRNAAAAVIDGKVFVVGGENASGPLQANEVYDPNTGQGGSWSEVQRLKQPIAAPGLAASTNVIPALFVFDAERQAGWRYEVATDQWAAIDSAASAAIARHVVELRNSMFLFGDLASTPPGSVSEYQPNYVVLVPEVGPRKP